MSVPAPPYSSGNRHPQQPQLGELGDDLVREAVLAVELLGDRRHLLHRELPDGVPEQLVLRREVEIHERRVLGGFVG